MKSSVKNKTIIVALLVGVVAVAGFLIVNGDQKANLLSSPNATTHTVELRPDGFHPEEITVRRGDTVVFKTTKGSYFWPASNLHPTHTIYSEFDPKEPIAPEETWSFRFDKAGTWKYHDHLAPYFTGTITVIEEKSAGPQSKSGCDKNAESLDCFQEKILAVLDKEGLDKTFDTIARLYIEEPRLPSACHYLTHNIGLAAYKHYLKDKDSVLTPKAAYCANGFYHGFMEAFLTAAGDVGLAKDFCTYAGEKLKDKAPDAELQCYHGIGHGAIEASLAKLPPARNEEDMIRPALETCEEAADTEEQLYRCTSGVFNAVANFYTTGEFGFEANTENPVWLCDRQPENYQESCYGNMNTVLTWLSGDDFQKAVGFVEQIPENQAVSTVRYLANMYTLLVARGNYERAISECRLLKESLRTPCIEGFAHGFLENGVPGEEYKESFAFCRDDALTQEERDICFKYALNLGGWYSLVKAREICGTVEPEYQKYCSNL